MRAKLRVLLFINSTQWPLRSFDTFISLINAFISQTNRCVDALIQGAGVRGVSLEVFWACFGRAAVKPGQTHFVKKNVKIEKKSQNKKLGEKM